MAENKWQAHRAGILNYWYYDEAEFEFADGRLMLRGSNGSGKSVTMQSLVTVLLDGVKRADRLDSFGSRSRRIEEYLLGEKEISSYDERTGYLYLEYKRENSEQYITTGIGLHARRGNTKVDFWGFILQNGRRIGQDFQLYKLGRDAETGKEQKIPMSRKELEFAIGRDGRVTTEQREYMAMVNQHVFGYQSLEQYEELMQLLIQLRSPKLSRDFRPSVIYEILNDSLPVLSEEDLRPLSETLENMERTKLSIEQLEREKSSFDRVCQAYDRYNQAVLADRGLMAARYEALLSQQAQKQKENEQGIREARAREAEAHRRQQELSVEMESLQEEQEQLRGHEAYKAAREKEERTHELQEIRAEHREKDKKFLEKRRRGVEVQDNLQQEEQRLEKLRADAEDRLDDMESLADVTDFRSHASFVQAFSLSDGQADEQFRLWLSSCKAYTSELAEVRKMLQEYERMQQKNAELEQELGKERQQLDDLRIQMEHQMESLEEARSRLVKAYYEWKAMWQQTISFPHEQESRLAAMLQSLYQDAQWQEVQELLQSHFGAEEQKLHAEIGILRADMEGLRRQEKEITEELRLLRETKEAEPELAEDYRSARARLSEQGIAYVPLYEAAEFLDSVDRETRERLESALLEAGLLSAVILKDNETASNLPADMAGAVLFSGAPVMMAESLLDYLQPVAGDSGISPARIADVLGSIRVDDTLYAPSEGGISVNIHAGAYRLGSLAGCALRREDALYIGKQAREAYRCRQIAEKEQELGRLQDELTEHQREQEAVQGKLGQLQEARHAFPSEQEVQKNHLRLGDLERQVQMQEHRVQVKDAEKKELSLKVRELQRGLRERRGDTRLGFSMEDYEQAREEMGSYQEDLGQLRLVQEKFAHASEMKRQYEKSVEQLQEETDELKGEILSLEMEERKLVRILEALERQLQELDAAAIERRIAEIAEKIRTLPEEQRKAIRWEAEAKTQCEQHQKRLGEILRQQAAYEILARNWKQLFEVERKRGFVRGKIEELPDAQELKELMDKWREEQKKENAVTLPMLAGRLRDAQFREQGVLMEYRMSVRDSEERLLPLPEMQPEDAEQFANAWQELRDRSGRVLFLVETEGRQESPYEQRNWLRQHLEEQRNLLSEQDKRIYQEIIMNSIGRTISDRIYGAEAWIRKMNGLMRQSETSSGLKFRLEWRPLRTEDDDELDASELVELLHADPETLKEEDMKRIVQHFQTRIDRARAEAEDAEDKAEESFQTKVRELLDYRKWFRFQLYFDQGEKIQKRELTDRAFFKFSGGEKAMAMYVPLFSAAYSRYQEAGKDAPYLITLDEAFAGVDEQNMRDMFHLVEQLHFNYIMNSQAIWGDYDVVPSLNIYELLRPLNAAYVTVAGYHWDGRRRTVMLEDTSEE